jgi:transcriptional regulator with XRE-family HTH domain/tetratricopeptide (TPR) repeat protein
MERARLSTARNEKGWSQEYVASRLNVDRVTVQRWEQHRTTPQPYHLQQLCELFGKTALELGLVEEHLVMVQHTTAPEDTTDDAYTIFRASHFMLRLWHIVCTWSAHIARYHELQELLILELEDNSMTDELMSRRDALRLLASLPVEICSLSALKPVLKHPVEEILTQCTAGITACWYLRRGKDLTFTSDVIGKYLPTLKEIAKIASTPQRKTAAELLAQCFLLKAVLSWNVTTPTDGIRYGQQAETYSKFAEQPLLQIISLRVQAAALCYANQWEQALHTALQANYLLDTTPKELIPQVARSYVYAGLATYQAYHGQKQDALTALKKAHSTFFEQPVTEMVPLWIDHSIGNLLLNDGLTHAHLGLYQGAVDSFEQIQMDYANDMTIPLGCRIEASIEQITAEVSRDDQPRDMGKCITLWIQGIEGAKTLRSNKHFGDAVVAFTAMRAAWPGEIRIKELREHILHW